MTQDPPPSIQRCFSASATHENGEVMRAPFRSEDLGGSSGGLQVATVKTSTSLRTKNLGKVPPRLDTLSILCIRNVQGYCREVPKTYVASSVI